MQSTYTGPTMATTTHWPSIAAWARLKRFHRRTMVPKVMDIASACFLSIAFTALVAQALLSPSGQVNTVFGMGLDTDHRAQPMKPPLPHSVTPCSHRVLEEGLSHQKRSYGRATTDGHSPRRCSLGSGRTSEDRPGHGADTTRPGGFRLAGTPAIGDTARTPQNRHSQP